MDEIKYNPKEYLCAGCLKFWGRLWQSHANGTKDSLTSLTRDSILSSLDCCLTMSLVPRILGSLYPVLHHRSNLASMEEWFKQKSKCADIFPVIHKHYSKILLHIAWYCIWCYKSCKVHMISWVYGVYLPVKCKYFVGFITFISVCVYVFCAYVCVWIVYVHVWTVSAMTCIHAYEGQRTTSRTWFLLPSWSNSDPYLRSHLAS